MSGVARAAAVVAVLCAFAGMISGLSLAASTAMGVTPVQETAER